MATVQDLPGSWGYLYNSPATLALDSNGYTASLTFWTTLGNLANFMTVVGGQPTTVTSSGGWTTTRRVPLQHPLYPGLWATSANAEAFGTASATSTELIDLWSHINVTVNFASVAYGTDGSDTPYMTMSTRGEGIYTAIPGRRLRFSNGELLGQDAGVFDGQTCYAITLYQCPNLSDDVLDSLVSKVNSTTFLGKPAGQVLFNSWSSDYQVSIGGGLTYTKQLQVTYKTYPWNQLYRSDGTLDTPIDADGNPPYESADLNQAIQT